MPDTTGCSKDAAEKPSCGLTKSPFLQTIQVSETIRNLPIKIAMKMMSMKNEPKRFKKTLP
jgi:hypothetical protein